MLPVTAMEPFLCRRPKNSSRLFNFLLGSLGIILIGATTSSAKSVPFQIEGPNSTAGGDLFTAEGSNELRASFSISAANDIQLNNYQNQTVSIAPGSTVTLNLQSFTLTDHSTLTLLGDATSTIIINVSEHFSLANSAKIVLAGGLQCDHVFFNVVGTGTKVTLRGKSILVGTLSGTQRRVRLNGHAIVFGTVLAQKLVIRQAAQVIPLPIVSQ